MISDSRLRVFLYVQSRVIETHTHSQTHKCLADQERVSEILELELSQS